MQFLSNHKWRNTILGVVYSLLINGGCTSPEESRLHQKYEPKIGFSYVIDNTSEQKLNKFLSITRMKGESYEFGIVKHNGKCIEVLVYKDYNEETEMGAIYDKQYPRAFVWNDTNHDGLPEYISIYEDYGLNPEVSIMNENGIISSPTLSTRDAKNYYSKLSDTYSNFKKLANIDSLISEY